MNNKYFNYTKNNYIIQLGGVKMLICLCGKSGAGKGYVSSLFEMLDNSITSLDIDKIGHQVIREKEVIKTLVDVFGNSVPKDDVINRSKLSELVFKSKPKMEKLKAITWRYIEKEIDYFINDNVNEIIILDWALLPKTKYFKMSNLTILVVAKAETRFNRLINREQIDLRKFRLRENATLTYLNNEFDYVISNDEDGIIKGW